MISSILKKLGYVKVGEIPIIKKIDGPSITRNVTRFVDAGTSCIVNIKEDIENTLSISRVESDCSCTVVNSKTIREKNGEYSTLYEINYTNSTEPSKIDGYNIVRRGVMFYHCEDSSMIDVDFQIGDKNLTLERNDIKVSIVNFTFVVVPSGAAELNEKMK